MANYYIHLTNQKGLYPKFEEVTEKVFLDRKAALNDDGSPGRYTENHFVISNGKIVSMVLTEVAVNEALQVVNRILNIPQFTGNIQGGFCSTPDSIMFENTRSSWLLQLTTGKIFKEDKSKSPPETEKKAA